MLSMLNVLTIDELTVNFSQRKSEGLLDDWHWLIGKNKIPLLITASGDAFLQDLSNNTIHFLDVCGGAIYKVAETASEFNSLLGQQKFVGDYFALEMVRELRASGIQLHPGQVYSFKVPPALGGDGTVENVEATDISVHFSIAGQIHAQICKVKPGTKVGSIVFNKPRKIKWWWPFS